MIASHSKVLRERVLSGVVDMSHKFTLSLFGFSKRIYSYYGNS